MGDEKVSSRQVEVSVQIYCYRLGYQRPTMELLSLMVVMSEGLGFNLCVVPFLNVCVPDLPQGQGQSMLEVVRVGLEMSY